MVYVHEVTYVLLRCSFFMVQESHAATLLMVYVHEVTYMLLRVDAFASIAPHGSCTRSDIRVATLCTLRWCMS